MSDPITISPNNPILIPAVTVLPSDGRELELRKSGDYVQWKYTDEPIGAWRNMVPLADIVGPPGGPGVGLPPGGATGQTLVKTSVTDFATAWGDVGAGDMAKAVYDPNSDGKVTSAVSADAVPWAGVTDKPSTFAPEAHTHPISDVVDLQEALDSLVESGEAIFFLEDEASGTVPGYKVMDNPAQLLSEAYITETTIVDGETIQEWITNSGLPGTTFIPDGVWGFHINAYKTGGSKETRLYNDIYLRNLAGTETLIGTTTNSIALTGTEVALPAFNIYIAGLSLLVTDRIVIKTRLRLIGGGSNPTSVTIGYAGSTAARLSTPTQGGLGPYAPVVHTHVIADTTGLQTALDGKQAAGSYAAGSHAHVIADTTGLQTALDGKQATLVSTTNIKTINGSSVLGAGDLIVGGGVSDGDKGDVVVTASGATWTLEDEYKTPANEIELHKLMGGGIKVEPYSIGIASNTMALSFNTHVILAVYIPKETLITGAVFRQVVQGVFVGSGYNGIGLYSVSGGTATLVAETGNNENIWKNAFGLVKAPFLANYTAAKGLYYVALNYGRSSVTTGPQLSGSNSLFATLSNLDYTNGNRRIGVRVIATMPASITLSSHSNGSGSAWVGLY